jgi:hypothetical protein
MGGAYSPNGEKRNAYRLLVGKPEGRRPLGRLRRRWLDNIRMDFVGVGWGDVDCIGLQSTSPHPTSTRSMTLAHDRDRDSSCEFGTELSGSIKCWETMECPNN